LFFVPLHYKLCSKRKEWGEPTLQGYNYTVIITLARMPQPETEAGDEGR
jgi:hypothetical protein